MVSEQSFLGKPISMARRKILLKYSCEEIYDRISGLCIFCEEQDTPGHHDLKHKGVEILMIEPIVPESEPIVEGSLAESEEYVTKMSMKPDAFSESLEAFTSDLQSSDVADQKEDQNKSDAEENLNVSLKQNIEHKKGIQSQEAVRVWEPGGFIVKPTTQSRSIESFCNMIQQKEVIHSTKMIPVVCPIQEHEQLELLLEADCVPPKELLSEFQDPKVSQDLRVVFEKHKSADNLLRMHLEQVDVRSHLKHKWRSKQLGIAPVSMTDHPSNFAELPKLVRLKNMQRVLVGLSEFGVKVLKPPHQNEKLLADETLGKLRSVKELMVGVGLSLVTSKEAYNLLIYIKFIGGKNHGKELSVAGQKIRDRDTYVVKHTLIKEICRTGETDHCASHQTKHIISYVWHRWKNKDEIIFLMLAGNIFAKEKKIIGEINTHGRSILELSYGSLKKNKRSMWGDLIWTEAFSTGFMVIQIMVLRQRANFILVLIMTCRSSAFWSDRHVLVSEKKTTEISTAVCYDSHCGSYSNMMISAATFKDELNSVCSLLLGGFLGALRQWKWYPPEQFYKALSNRSELLWTWLKTVKFFPWLKDTCNDNKRQEACRLRVVVKAGKWLTVSGLMMLHLVMLTRSPNNLTCLSVTTMVYSVISKIENLFKVTMFLLLTTDTFKKRYEEDAWPFMWSSLKEFWAAVFQKTAVTAKSSLEEPCNHMKNHKKLLSPENMSVVQNYNVSALFHHLPKSSSNTIIIKIIPQWKENPPNQDTSFQELVRSKAHGNDLVVVRNKMRRSHKPELCVCVAGAMAVKGEMDRRYILEYSLASVFTCEWFHSPRPPDVLLYKTDY